jgi:hypothetical protein
MGGDVAHIGERRSAGRVLVGGTPVRRPFGICSHRWEDSIIVYLEDNRIGVCGLDWFRIGHVWRFLMKTVMNVWLILLLV